MRSSSLLFAVGASLTLACGSEDSNNPGSSSGGSAGSAGSSAGTSSAGSAGAGATGGVAGNAGSSGAGGQPALRTDIVVILVDDLDSATFDQLLAADALPNIESRIAARGITFSESFVSNSLCCPSRATFLTGQYTHNQRYNDLPDYVLVRTGVDHGTTSLHKLVRYRTDAGVELENEEYDLRSDPFELTSVGADPGHAAVRGELSPLLDALSACKGAACRAAED